MFKYYGYPISEEMLFGVASGLSFLYINQSSSPTINGREKVFEFEKKIAERLNIEIKCESGKDYPKVLTITKQLLDLDYPILIYVDMPHMKYLGMNPNSHFCGHAVVLYGYDEDTGKFWIRDRDNHDYPIRVSHGEIAQDYHYVSYEELEKVCYSAHCPFPANKKYLIFDFRGFIGIQPMILKAAIKEMCESC